MVNVAVNVLAVTADPDIGTLSISGRRGQSDLTMVIEVVRAFPIVDARPTLPTSSRDDDVLVPGFLKVLEFQGKWFDLEALRESLHRTAFRMETSRPPTKIGVLVSKQAVFMLFRSERRVAVSDPIEYTGTDPHPAAALANAFNVAVEDPNAEDYSGVWDSLSRSRA
ncbi:hypothetical protein IWQ56_000408 [Coemansia nantahalensis]|nr:hypothetical protein IWQ56_000408 [Coemansia nantahalensis]